MIVAFEGVVAALDVVRGHWWMMTDLLSDSLEVVEDKLVGLAQDGIERLLHAVSLRSERHDLIHARVDEALATVLDCFSAARRYVVDVLWHVVGSLLDEVHFSLLFNLLHQGAHWLVQDDR